MTEMKGSTSLGTETHALHKEWDDALCPICMDHPHNAVLLLCSSFDKGCRPYICDSSYRHSNCLDRFKKYFRNTPEIPENSSGSRNNNLTTEDNIINESSAGLLEPHRCLEMQDGALKCPLCRGTVKGWEIIEEARQYLDLKQRNCSLESCTFFGNYGDLRRHARRVHPTTRPAIVDPSRQRSWLHIENQQEYGDVVSAIRSTMPGAIVLGDYVIETGDNNVRNHRSGENNGPLLTSFILYQMMRPFSPPPEPRNLSRAWRRYRRTTSGTFYERRHLWGENLLGMQEDDADWTLPSDMGDDDDTPPIPRRRRRFTRSRPDEDLP